MLAALLTVWMAWLALHWMEPAIWLAMALGMVGGYAASKLKTATADGTTSVGVGPLPVLAFSAFSLLLGLWWTNTLFVFVVAWANGVLVGMSVRTARLRAGLGSQDLSRPGRGRQQG